MRSMFESSSLFTVIGPETRPDYVALGAARRRVLEPDDFEWSWESWDDAGASLARRLAEVVRGSVTA